MDHELAEVSITYDTMPEPRRKPGRPKTGRKLASFSVMLPPWLHEWAMGQPEGLSPMIRRLLYNEYYKALAEHTPVQPPPD